MDFASLGLRAEILRALHNEGYTVPTPIQAQAIPLVLQGRDIVAGAQTGTGKTAAFTLPLLQQLWEAPGRQKPGRRQVRALVLTPTRELAAQVEESVRRYGRHLPLTSTTVFGGVNINPQIHALMRGVDILVATPGRLLDHVNQRTVDLSRVEILVLDEADRMLDMGFIRDVRDIIALLPAKRQSLLFSATFSEEIKRLTDTLFNEPIPVEVARSNAESDLVTQTVHFSIKENKHDLLIHLLVQENIQQALVFVRTKHGADKLATRLRKDGVSAVPIHGNLSQMQRTKALSDFKHGRARILVATDIASRGLDIEQLPHVINFEMPYAAEDYVHRIGRTGRAGMVGEAISFVSPEERTHLFAVERLLKKRIEQGQAVGFVPATPEPKQKERQEQAVARMPRKPKPLSARGEAGQGRQGGFSPLSPTSSKRRDRRPRPTQG
jgi:ATP-dependent RNA helicase RhlE